MECHIDYQPAGDILEGRVILVTGAGDGIGRAAARCFAAHGATSILVGRTLSKLEAVYDEIEVAGGPQPAIFPLNLEGATGKEYLELADRLSREFGRLDGLLHNAGLLGDMVPFADYDLDLWARVMHVNVTGPLWMTQALLPLLQASRDASVILTSSSVGRKARAKWGAYAVSKFATEGFMQLLADELAGTSSVRVNTLNPGATRTAMRRRAYPDENPATLRTPEAIMPTYLWLMGPDSRERSGEAFDAQPSQTPRPASA